MRLARIVIFVRLKIEKRSAALAPSLHRRPGALLLPHAHAHHPGGEVGEDVARAVEETRERGGRVVAVGTTSVRALETCADEGGRVRPGVGETDLYLHPGRPLRVVEALFTNFHLPRSSLLFLVSALTGREKLLALYGEAVRERYRFFSYGDAMFFHRGSSDSSSSSSL